MRNDNNWKRETLFLEGKIKKRGREIKKGRKMRTYELWRKNNVGNDDMMT